MKRLLAAAAAASFLVLASCQDAQTPLQPETTQDLSSAAAPDQALIRGPQSLADRWIVVFADQGKDPGDMPERMVRAAGGRLHFTYRHAIKGFAATLPTPAVEALRRNPMVAYVEADQEVWAWDTQTNATWGLDRVDQRALPLDKSYTYEQTGAGVTAYIIDTGIRYDHTQFGGRVSFGFDAFGGNGADCNGHGTHVAGTVGGTTYGVAKAVSLVAVRVLDCNGSGTTTGVIAGVDWVRGHAAGAAVANMSLGGGPSTTLDNAVKNSIAAGVSYAVAAGNSSRDACLYSPARVPEAMTIGATTSTDAKASYSNYGNCVDWFAPGSSITSAYYTSSTATATMSGTSMASPHTAGAAALYLQAHPGAAPTDVRQALYDATTRGIVASSRTTNNHLLYSLFDGGSEPPPDNKAPTASFTYGCTYLNCTFNGSGSSDSDGTISSYAWSFGDNSTASGVSPSYSFSAAGTYTVTLTVTDDDEATGTASQQVTVEAEDPGSDPEPGDLSIDKFALTNTSNPQFARVIVDWAVSGDGLSTVKVEIQGEGNTDSQTWTVSGSSAAGQHEFSFRRGFGSYTVTLTVTDVNGQISETKPINLSK